MAHKAFVAKIDSVIEIPNANNVKIAVILGEQVVVSKNAQVGDVGIFFPVDVQLSEEYAKNNNLYRHASMNADNTKSGFFDDNRRVRAQTLLKVKSCGLFMTFDSLSYTGKTDFTLGEQFDEINGKKICQKYYSEQTIKAMNNAAKPKQAKKNYAPYFDKHVDSDQFKHFANSIPVGSLIYIHAKVHGTSHRSGRTWITQELSWAKKFVNKLTKRSVFPDKIMGNVVGTRNVVLKAGEGDKEGFHGAEQFRFDVAKMLEPFLEDGMIVYGEIAGYANGKSIMPVVDSKGVKNKEFTKKYGEKITYKYGCAEHEFRFHVYRITRLTASGENIDMTQAQLDKWVGERGLLGPVSVYKPFVYDGDVATLQTLVESLTERSECLTEDFIDSSHPSEGLILRVETGSNTPKFYKNKSFAFRVMEGLCEIVDTEDAS